MTTPLETGRLIRPPGEPPLPPEGDQGQGIPVLIPGADLGLLATGILAAGWHGYDFVSGAIQEALNTKALAGGVEAASYVVDAIDFTSESVFGRPTFPQWSEDHGTGDFLRAAAEVVQTPAFEMALAHGITMGYLVAAVSRLPGGQYAIGTLTGLGLASGRLVPGLIKVTLTEIYEQIQRKLDEDGVDGLITEAQAEAEEYADPTGFVQERGLLEDGVEGLADIAQDAISWSRNAALPLEYRLWGRRFYRWKANGRIRESRQREGVQEEPAG